MNKKGQLPIGNPLNILLGFRALCKGRYNSSYCKVLYVLSDWVPPLKWENNYFIYELGVEQERP